LSRLRPRPWRLLARGLLCRIESRSSTSHSRPLLLLLLLLLMLLKLLLLLLMLLPECHLPSRLGPAKRGA